MAQNQNQGQDRNQGRQGGSQGGRGQGGDTSNRGFASMDEDKQRAIAAEGGRAAHAQGTAHEFDSEEAREAGRKGGQARAGGSSDRDVQGSSSGSRGQQAQGRERDEQGQFMSSDDNRGGGSRSSRSDDESGRGRNN